MTRFTCGWAFLPFLLLPSAMAAGAAGGAPIAIASQVPPAWDLTVDPGRPGQANADGAPAARSITQARQEWNWGELVAGRTYRGEIELSNRCAEDIRVGLFAYGLADLVIQSTATIPGGGSIVIPYRITPTAAATPNGIVRGELVVWFPSRSEEACPSFRLLHDVSGRVRAATADDDALEKTTIANAQAIDACVKWWVSQEKPGDRTEAECAPIIRQIVVRSRQVFERHRLDAAAALSKVPSDGIEAMSMAQLSALRRDIAAALGARK